MSCVAAFLQKHIHQTKNFVIPHVSKLCDIVDCHRLENRGHHDCNSFFSFFFFLMKNESGLWNFLGLCFHALWINCSYYLISIAPTLIYIFSTLCLFACKFHTFQAKPATETRVITPKSLFGIQIFVPLPFFYCRRFANRCTPGRTQFVIWDGKHLILAEFKQEMDTEKKPANCSIANRPLQFITNGKKIYIYIQYIF